MDSAILPTIIFFSGFGFGMGFYSFLMYNRLAEIGQSVALLAGAVNETSKMMSKVLERKDE